MKPLVSVLTPTIPERNHLLREAIASVKSQTLPDWQREHLILEDTEREGCSHTVNALADQARGEWIFILGDDDLMLPGCLETHLAASGDADIVYAPPLVWGEDGAQFCTLPPPNIPSASLIRTSLWYAIRGYKEDALRTEDRFFYEAALLAGARFVRTERSPTWVYRFHGGNKSRQQLEG